MSVLSNMPVENGARVQIACEVFTGVAGVRSDDRGGEFACPGVMPLRLPALTGTVDGRAVRILALRKSEVVKAMLVVSFEYLESGA